MRKNLNIIAVIGLALVLMTGAGCTASGKTTAPVPITILDTNMSGNTQQSIQDISVADAYKLIQANKSNPDFKIIDVRTPEEYAAGYIQGAVNINYYDANFKDALALLDRNLTYLIYCRTGHRSGLARDIMKEMGFLHVYNMLGGITDWTAQNYPVVQ